MGGEGRGSGNFDKLGKYAYIALPELLVLFCFSGKATDLNFVRPGLILKCFKWIQILKSGGQTKQPCRPDLALAYQFARHSSIAPSDQTLRVYFFRHWKKQQWAIETLVWSFSNFSMCRNHLGSHAERQNSQEVCSRAWKVAFLTSSQVIAMWWRSLDRTFSSVVL